MSEQSENVQMNRHYKAVTCWYFQFYADFNANSEKGKNTFLGHLKNNTPHAVSACWGKITDLKKVSVSP